MRPSKWRGGVTQNTCVQAPLPFRYSQSEISERLLTDRFDTPLRGLIRAGDAAEAFGAAVLERKVHPTHARTHPPVALHDLPQGFWRQAVLSKGS